MLGPRALAGLAARVEARTHRINDLRHEVTKMILSALPVGIARR
jgi:hypothetical protein